MAHILKIVVSLIALVSFAVLSSCKKNEFEPGTVLLKGVLETNDTLAGSLQKLDISPIGSFEITNHLRSVFNPRLCKPGDSYEILADTANVWMRFTYYPRSLDYYVVTKTTYGITSARKTKKTSLKEYTASGTIATSLWESMRAQNIDPELIVTFAEIFSWQIDFLTDPRSGDTYKLVWERTESEDGIRVRDKILGAQYLAKNRTQTAVLFTYSDGKSDYYNIEGESLRRAFLKAPLQFRRISSFFTKKRFHPILKRFRPHLGIDYAAPSGTPVSSIGDGTVQFAARKGGFGKLVIIRHLNNYVTYYGHLSGYARGIRSGAHVTQGQLIGYVGSTGLSTGPHLDFRIKKDGHFINFLTMKFPVVKKIARTYMPAFKKTARETLTKLAKIH